MGDSVTVSGRSFFRLVTSVFQWAAWASRAGSRDRLPYWQWRERSKRWRHTPGRGHEQFIGNTFRRLQQKHSIAHLLHPVQRKVSYSRICTPQTQTAPVPTRSAGAVRRRSSVSWCGRTGHGPRRTDDPRAAWPRSRSATGSRAALGSGPGSPLRHLPPSRQMRTPGWRRSRGRCR
jgi:hypothetical protein